MKMHTFHFVVIVYSMSLPYFWEANSESDEENPKILFEQIKKNYAKTGWRTHFLLALIKIKIKFHNDNVYSICIPNLYDV